MFWSNKMIFLVEIFLVLLLPCFAYAGEVKTLEIGEKAPDFTLVGTDGKYYSLEDFDHAEVLVIIFTANHCPTAQAYEDRIIQLVNDYKDNKVAVVAISSNNPEALRLDEMGYTDLGDSFEDMKIRAKDKGFNFPYLYDGEQQTAAIHYGALATPHVFIFDEKRQLRYAGRFDNSENPAQVTTHDTRNAIDAILAGKKIEVEKTKTFGCSIKWADKIESTKKALEQWNMEPVQVEMVDLAAIKNLVENDSDNLRLINIWTTWCGPCVVEFPHLIEINLMSRNRDFEMITISLDNPDKNDKVLKFLEKNHASTKNYHYSLEDK
jgi:thiol-disulfide isomerase/thioredoxin